jgi:UDP-3-O-[3-hydroxymyristoyl] glucosamine N-acyltransferase
MFTGNTLPLSVLVDGTSAEVIRDVPVANVGKIPTRLPDRLVYAGAAKYLAELHSHEGIAAVVVPRDIADQVPERYGVAIAPAAHIAAMEIFEAMLARPNFQWEDFPTRIAPSANIHPNAIIAPRNVVIGERSHIDAGTVVRERSVIGDDCYVGPLSVLGCEAFEMMPGSKPQRLMKQAGGIRMWNNSTVLSATMIVRATFGGFTEIREGACIDNLIHIAHDVDVGRDVSVIACAEVSGRVVLGDGSYVGPNATISNGLNIGSGATITLGSVVVRDVPQDVRVSGNFAVPHDKWIRFVKSVAKDQE